MGTRKTILPNVPDVQLPGDMGRMLNAVKEVLDVHTGRRGDPLDRVVTFRDLGESGLASIEISGGAGGGATITGGGSNNGSPGFLNPPGVGTGTLPNGHLNVRTRPIWDGIMILWDWPPGAIEYAYTEIWAAAPNDPALPLVSPPFSQAVIVGTSPGNSFAHTGIGLQQTRYYWIRYIGFVSPANVSAGAPHSLYTPSSTGPGVRGVTSLDPEYVLGVLHGQITESQLFSELNGRIDLVDGDGVGSVNQRLLAASTADNAAIASFASIVKRNSLLTASYGIKIDVAGYIAGFGISVEQQKDNNPLSPTYGQPIPVTNPDGSYNATAHPLVSQFIIRADRFAIVKPQPAGTPGANGGTPRIPFVIGQIPDPANPSQSIDAVGIDGQLVVNGTITASAIQAGTIGAREINAGSIWAGVVGADRVFASVFATSGDLNWRVEIGGQNETYPFWYGNGQKGGNGSTFYFDRTGTLKLAGAVYVSAGGFFQAGSIGGQRVEIGGAGGYLLWAGSGPKTNANAKFYFNNAGDLFIKGNPVTFPVAQANGPISLTVLAVEGFPTIPVLVQGFIGLHAGDAEYEKTIVTTLLVNGAATDTVTFSTRAYRFPTFHQAVLMLAPGAYVFSFGAACTGVSGANTIPPVTIDYLRAVAIQTKAMT